MGLAKPMPKQSQSSANDATKTSMATIKKTRLARADCVWRACQSPLRNPNKDERKVLERAIQAETNKTYEGIVAICHESVSVCGTVCGTFAGRQLKRQFKMRATFHFINGKGTWLCSATFDNQCKV